MNSTMLAPQRQLRQEEFPPLLHEIPDAPEQLFLRGTLPPRETLLLCVVGSRAATPYGRRMTQKLITGLAGEPVAIVSGLALGTDAHAHEAALECGLPTVAVLPSSTDDESIYPRSNYALANRILSKDGALLSERGGPWKPQLHDFARRNRLMAGMSQATLIIEAGEKSGTLITARLALDYNREVLAVPHELGRESGAGSNRLIREGAVLVRDSEDVLESLGLKRDRPKQATLPTDLNEAESKTLSALTEALYKDELLLRCEFSAQEMNIVLSSLSLRGLIVERLGKIERV